MPCLYHGAPVRVLRDGSPEYFSAIQCRDVVVVVEAPQMGGIIVAGFVGLFTRSYAVSDIQMAQSCLPELELAVRVVASALAFAAGRPPAGVLMDDGGLAPC